MKNPTHKPASLLHRVSLRRAFLRRPTVFSQMHAVVAGLSVLAVFAIPVPELAHGQTAGYYTQNGGVVWYGAQQQAHHPRVGHYPAPGYVQPPAYSQPAVGGSYAPGGYAGAANAAATNQYGGTTAWQQPGFVPQTYQQNPAYGIPQQPYGYYQPAPNYPAPNYGNGQTTAYGQTFVDRQRQQYAQTHAYPGYGHAYPGYGYGYPVTGYPSHSTPPPGHPAYVQQTPQQTQQQHGQQHAQQQQPHQQQNPHVQNQLTPVQQAAREAATNISPNGVPVLSPAASRFFQNLQGPNRSTYNQNRQNYSFSGQTRPSNQIPNTTWQSGSRFGQTYSNRSSHNQATTNQNRFNYSLHNLTRPGFRGY